MSSAAQVHYLLQPLVHNDISLSARCMHAMSLHVISHVTAQTAVADSRLCNSRQHRSMYQTNRILEIHFWILEIHFWILDLGSWKCIFG